MVAGGDFGGNLMIFSTESSLDSNEPLYRALVVIIIFVGNYSEVK